MWRRRYRWGAQPPWTYTAPLLARLAAVEARLAAVERTAHWHCPRCRRSTESSALFACQPGDQVCRPIKPAEAA